MGCEGVNGDEATAKGARGGCRALSEIVFTPNNLTTPGRGWWVGAAVQGGGDGAGPKGCGEPAGPDMIKLGSQPPTNSGTRRLPGNPVLGDDLGC